MSNKYLIIILIVASTACGSKKPKDPDKIYFDNASDYNSYISDQFDEVLRLWNATLTVMDDSLAGYQTLDSLATASEEGVLMMDKLADFEGDTLYRNSAKDFFTTMHQLSINEFNESIAIMIQGEVSDSLFFRIDELGKLMGEKKDKAVQDLQAAQLSFKHEVESK